MLRDIFVKINTCIQNQYSLNTPVVYVFFVLTGCIAIVITTKEIKIIVLIYYPWIFLPPVRFIF